MTVNLKSPPFKVADIAKFNAKLAASVLYHYRKLIEENPNKLIKSGHSVKGSNQAFYDWQQNGGWKIFAQQPEVRQLLEYMQTATDMFLRTIGQDEDFVRNRGRELFAWATVHESCISHAPHSHPNEIVSGVYYVKMPDDAGAVMFDDPRGPLPPFDNRITVRPKEGDLILFPSWLIHQVEPTGGASERISIPFNIHGNWESTSQIEVTFPVQT